MARHERLLAPLLAAIVAGSVVAGVSLATDSSPSTSTVTVTRSGAAEPRQSSLTLHNAFVGVVRMVSPSVVQIEDQQGLGSGIVLDAAGDIVTNNHVVSGGGTVSVASPDSRR